MPPGEFNLCTENGEKVCLEIKALSGYTKLRKLLTATYCNISGIPVFLSIL
jgi:hypothetical protein